ncbi:uncharacterized protein PHALS_14570 [Plasmopara halstedii]|uniref:Uncharacterized protein n=1 Tax=Plasmopara halstedii TaxID=4781 RepID=A0A0P1AKL3_PLAHL|nr:uncharacterized protein PHALS_14570 [Plasmopara halstedii]CEG41807.1 hypothetical protein PHALS_14570 [Plasmopara halstedii]|eukprot:XP_024578176.1 hypothetical protein PHALS_14570 [Plasmopara halstedii]
MNSDVSCAEQSAHHVSTDYLSKAKSFTTSLASTIPLRAILLQTNVSDNFKDTSFCTGRPGLVAASSSILLN